MLQFSPGWTLTIDGRTGEILRVNRMMRGAAVGAGTHRIAYRRPGFSSPALASLEGELT
ncbi:MAG: hypothetical protein JO329_01080 [Planctomycetaceae bacterium]|nr:hypothetical protein [Planctomycetaceae bacterium]